MDSTPSFSERHGFSSASKPITVRYEAPPFLREGILMIAEKSGISPDGLRKFICRTLDETPNKEENWSASNVMRECSDLIHSCEWFEVYDICEALAKARDLERNLVFEENLNKFFQKKGIGWKMEDGELSIRGEEDYERTIVDAQASLEAEDRETAALELEEALQDLSRRPEPDITGAIQHSMAALECLAKDISGKSNRTLGDLIKGLNLPAPVDQAVEKMWGFASNQGRHVAEGKRPDFPEAMLTVHFCSAIISYLMQKQKES